MKKQPKKQMSPGAVTVTFLIVGGLAIAGLQQVNDHLREQQQAASLDRVMRRMNPQPTYIHSDPFKVYRESSYRP